LKFQAPSLDITEVVDDYMASTFNNSQKYFKNYLIHAKWVWKQLFLNSLDSTKHKYVPIDKTTTPYSVIVPKDCLRLFSVQLTNGCDQLVDMSENRKMNVLPKPLAGAGCGCDTCNCDNSSCGSANEFTVRFVDHTIDGQVYTEKIWNKKSATGDIVEVRHIPVKDYTDATHYTVKIIESIKTLCSLDVKPCGCIVTSAANEEKLKRFNCFSIQKGGACSLDALEERICGNGEFKVEQGRIFLKNHNKNATHVILSYQTNGECPYEEILIPEYAVDAMHFGMHFRVTALSNTNNRLATREAQRQFNMKVTELDEFLNPVDAREFMMFQGLIPKWGTDYVDCLVDGPKVYSLPPVTKPPAVVPSALPIEDVPPVVVTPPPDENPPPPTDHIVYSDQYSNQYA
jgi:hypothetical protein